MIAIVDYGMGNTRSVLNSLEFLKIDAKVTRDPHELEEAEKLILPGVGSFGEGMESIKELGLEGILTTEVREKEKLILGICLGMQLFADTGYEHGVHKGLGWIPGEIKRFDFEDKKLHVPHVGWNNVEVEQENPLFPDPAVSPDFYFVHSFYFVAESAVTVSSWCSYGMRFAASVERKNIFGVQFHPEKSHNEGLTLLKNFSQMAL